MKFPYLEVENVEDEITFTIEKAKQINYFIPERGKDYWTEDDQKAIQDQIDAEITTVETAKENMLQEVDDALTELDEWKASAEVDLRQTEWFLCNQSASTFSGKGKTYTNEEFLEYLDAFSLKQISNILVQAAGGFYRLHSYQGSWNGYRNNKKAVFVGVADETQMFKNFQINLLTVDSNGVTRKNIKYPSPDLAYDALADIETLTNDMNVVKNNLVYISNDIGDLKRADTELNRRITNTNEYVDLVRAEVGEVVKNASDAVEKAEQAELSAQEAVESVANKVDKEEGKSLVSDTEITKLSQLQNYTAGSGINIENGVISCTFADGDEVRY